VAVWQALDGATADTIQHQLMKTTQLQLQVTFWMTIVWSIMPQSPDKVSLNFNSSQASGLLRSLSTCQQHVPFFLTHLINRKQNTDTYNNSNYLCGQK